VDDRAGRRSSWVPAVRWIARLWGAASVGLLAAFVVGEGVYPSGLGEWVGLLCFPFGISVGMILAWWKETIGGIITVGCLLSFYAIHFATAGVLPRGWAWLAFAAPGFLFLTLALVDRRARSASS
jgi:hypothetical protein